MYSIGSVKLECERKLTLCRGCLTSDRRLELVQNQVNLFFSLLGPQQDGNETHLLLCWECIANLKRIQTFQSRIQHAQFILQKSFYELEDDPITPLSTLSPVNKDFYDYTIDFEETGEEKVAPTAEVEISIVKLENSDDNENCQDLNDGIFSDDELLNLDRCKLEAIEEKPIKTESGNELKKLSIRRYECKATVKKLDVDITDLKKRCTKVKLTEKEIEDLLVRDKHSLGFNKLPNRCKECKNSYRRAVDLRRHLTFNHVKHTFPLQCTECDAIVTSHVALQKHWIKHNVYYKCDLCGWLSHSLPSITRHHHKAHTSVYCCNTCDVTCRTLREFSNHYKEKHERIICNDCGKSFIKKRRLEVHIRRHHAAATCTECDRTYSHYHVLENHYRMYHPHLIRADTRTELAYCVECDKQFPSVYKYRRHLATAAKHTPPKRVRIPCPECNKVFARKIRMTNHYDSVHRNTTKHRCDICNKTFCSAFSARTHKQHVHEKIPMPKNKICDICGRGFSTNRILSNHRRTHTGERPFKCSHCPATFAQRTAMKTHERTQHKLLQWGTPDALNAAATLLQLGDKNC